MRIFAIVVLGTAEMVLAIFELVVTIFRLPVEYLLDRVCKKYSYLNWLRQDLADCESILDVGCGLNSPILKIGLGYKADALDIYGPYVQMHEIAGDYRNAKVMNILEAKLDEKQYDAVVVCDVLEHLPREAVLNSGLIEDLEKSACKKVIIFTPNGYMENDVQEGNVYQRHMSAWEAEDFTKRGYRVKGACGLRYILGKAGKLKYRPYRLFGIFNLISLPFMTNRPRIADHTYAVKDIDE